MSRSVDQALMRMAIALARDRWGSTGPNPAVGCVIAARGRPVASGATALDGRPHAEEQALELAGYRARGATAYVSLEPCGERTSGAPSCAARLAAAGIARVVYACANRDPRSCGRGPAALAAAGIRVEKGLLAGEAADLYHGA
jgi:diaminohydroxyphosphoribosylaminopyrimidine deaminase/5-amino-6-(5-phosphoribosylamino)uracil reductase